MFYHSNCRRCSKTLHYVLCRVFITQQKISTPLSAKRYLCDIWAFLNSLCNWESFWLCVHVRACDVYVCFYCIFHALILQLPYLKFHNKIFATNWSQIWMFSEDLIQYILSLKNGNPICKKNEIKKLKIKSWIAGKWKLK